MRILVTGAAGFIGSHLAEALVGRGDDVVGFDNFDPFYDPAIKRGNVASLAEADGFRLVEGDLRDLGAVEGVFADGSFDVVVHLGARAGVRASLEDPPGYVEANVTGTARLLEAIRASGAGGHVFASSSSVYGNRANVPFREDDRVDRPVSPYAATKKAGEEMCHVYAELFGVRTVCLRFFTVYGPRQRPEMAIHKFVRRILAGDPIPVFGDGSMERDFTYVDDIVAGVVRAIDRVADIEYEIVNLGNSAPVSLAGLIERIGEACGVEPVIDRRPVPPGDVRRTCADVTRAGELLDWAPTTPLGEGLARFVTWYRERFPAAVA